MEKKLTSTKLVNVELFDQYIGGLLDKTITYLVDNHDDSLSRFQAATIVNSRYLGTISPLQSDWERFSESVIKSEPLAVDQRGAINAEFNHSLKPLFEDLVANVFSNLQAGHDRPTLKSLKKSWRQTVSDPFGVMEGRLTPEGIKPYKLDERLPVYPQLN